MKFAGCSIRRLDLVPPNQSLVASLHDRLARLSQKCDYLEQENLGLRHSLEAAQRELAELRATSVVPRPKH